MLTSVILTLMQGHNGSAKAKDQRWIISKAKQAISIKLATTVGKKQNKLVKPYKRFQSQGHIKEGLPL